MTLNKINRLKKLLNINDDFLVIRGIEISNILESIPDDIEVEPELDFVINKKKKGIKKIKKFKVIVERDNKHDKSEPPNEFLPPLPFAMYILGVVRAGKTTLLNSLLDVYIGAFDEIIIMSPTAKLDPEMRLIIDKYKGRVFLSLKPLPKILNKLEKMNTGKDPKEKIKTLIIMDDCISEIFELSRKDNSIINQLACNRRHYGVSLILLSQYYKRIPPILRTNFDSFALFRNENQTERRKIIEELSGFMGNKLFEELFDKYTKEPYSALTINYQGERKYIYTRNFNEIIPEIQ